MMTPKMIREGFGQRMKLLREAWEFRFRRSFAEHLGIKQDAAYKYEQGTRVPRPESLYLIKDRTGATSDWLLYGDWDTLPSQLAKLLREYQRHRADR